MIDNATLFRLHEQARKDHAEERAFMVTVEDVWKGIFPIPKGVADSPLQIVNPSDGYTLVNKMVKLLAVRSKKRIEVPMRGEGTGEARKVDKLERFVKAWAKEMHRTTGADIVRDGTFMALLRGRAGLQPLLTPNGKPPFVRAQVLDGLDYYPMYGYDGIEYYTTERWMNKWELFDYFKRLPEEQQANLDLPPEDSDDLYPNDLVKLLEYFDDKRYIWAVMGTSQARIVADGEHGHGRVPLREIRLNANSLRDKRWASQPFLGPVVDDIKNKAILESKMASGVETNYFGLLLAQDPANGISRINPYAGPGQFQHLSPDTKLEHFRANLDAASLQQLYGVFEGKINKATLSQLAFALELPDVSGFATQQVLSIIQDDLGDSRDQIEQAIGLLYGDVLALHEKYAPPEGWEYPMEVPGGGKMNMEKITADDIDGHHYVNVKIKVSLPADKLQKVTTFNSLYQLDQSGKPRMDFDTAFDLSELEDEVEDSSGMKRRMAWEWAKNTDPELQQLELARIKADYRGEIEEQQKQVDKDGRRLVRKEQRKAERDIERGLSEDVLLPAEIANDPQKMAQLVQMLQQGQSAEGALAALQGDSFGSSAPQMLQQPVPDSQQPGPPVSDQTQQIMATLFPGAQQMPDGMQGYEGIAPAALPPAAQGAVPRQTQDQARLSVENAQELQQRGALPPRK